MLLDNVVGNIQAQAGALAHGFGGKKGVEYFSQVFLGLIINSE